MIFIGNIWKNSYMGSYFAIVTCRNSESNITDAIESLQRQSVKPLYTIVIDDGSRDNTASILEELKVKYPTIHIITNPDLGYDISRVVRNLHNAIVYARMNKLQPADYHMISTDDTVYAPNYAETI